MKIKKKHYLLILLFLSIAFVFIWINRKNTDLDAALKMAGANQSELKKVLNHFSNNKADSLKLKAAKFLIANMPEHYGIKQELKNRFEEKVEFDFSTFKAGEHVRLSHTLDSLGFRFIQTEATYDIETITAKYLIENIELAFEAWQYPWCEHLSFNEFCEYILPYRCQSEQLSDYRRYFKEKYSWLIDSLKNKNDVKEAATILQRHLKKEVRYSSKYSGFYHGFLPPILMEQIRVGACEKMGNYCMLVMRSCGIPITFDQILYWSTHDNGHVHNSIIARNGTEYYFSLTDSPPALRKIDSCTPKVWRTTYQLQKKGIWNEETDEEIYPCFLNKHYIDITDKYVTVANLTMNIPTINNTKLIYLCTYNLGNWRPCSWSKIENGGMVHFANTTTDLLYSLAKYKNGVISPIGWPFIFDSSGKIIKKKPKKGSVEMLKLMIKSDNEEVEFYEDSNGNRHYTIYYWDNEWLPITTVGIPYTMNETKTKWIKIENDSLIADVYYKLVYENAPANAIFRESRSSKVFAVKNNLPQY